MIQKIINLFRKKKTKELKDDVARFLRPPTQLEKDMIKAEIFCRQFTKKEN